MLNQTERLRWMEKAEILPFDLDFFRALGFEFGEDWDGELIIKIPDEVKIEQIVDLIRKFSKGIKKRLYFEGQKTKRVLVGGPLNGKPYINTEMPNKPIVFHIKRGEWAVYTIKSHEDPRGWFVGMTTSRKKAKLMRRS